MDNKKVAKELVKIARLLTGQNKPITKAQAKKKTMELWQKSKSRYANKVDRLLDSGGFDIESYEDNYRLPMNLATVIFQELSNQHSPQDAKDKKEVKNLSYYV